MVLEDERSAKRMEEPPRKELTLKTIELSSLRSLTTNKDETLKFRRNQSAKRKLKGKLLLNKTQKSRRRLDSPRVSKMRLHSVHWYCGTFVQKYLADRNYSLRVEPWLQNPEEGKLVEPQ